MRDVRSVGALWQVVLGVMVAAWLALTPNDASAQQASTLLLQCNSDERLSRIVVRTGHRDHPQFLAIDCSKPNGARRIFKAGIERGTRHEIMVPQDLTHIHFAKGSCKDDGDIQFVRICSLRFQFADNTSTQDFGTQMLVGSQKSVSGNGEVYGIAAVFRREQADVDSGFVDLRVVTRKLDAKSDPLFDIEGVLETVRTAMDGAMGYVAVIRNPAGARIGFVRAGWAISPLDENLGQHAGQFDVHTKAAVGSTTKAWASAVAALRVDEFTQADTLGTPFQTYLPRRWRDELHSRFRQMTVVDIIKHQAGFRFSGGGEPARDRLRNGDVPFDGCPLSSTPPYAFCYSNTAGGMFHYILAHMMLASQSGAPAKEDSIQHLGNADYDREITRFTGQFYEDFVQTHILGPVSAVANCDSRAFLGQHRVAAAYSGPGDRTGVLPASSHLHCASGGWVISMNDLTKVLHAISQTDTILNAQSRNRLFSFGSDRVWQPMFAFMHVHNGLHDGMRAGVVRLNSGYTAAIVYNSQPTVSIGNAGDILLANAFRNNLR